MPRTPTKKVTQLTPLSPARGSAAAFGGQEASALGQLGQATQQVAGNVADIALRKDQYVAKNKYLDARKQADAFVQLQLNKEAENAFESTAATEEMMREINKANIEGMSPRQKELFEQNWIPSSISNTQRVSQHEMSQRKAAETNTNNALLETEVRSFEADGSRLSYEKSLAALKSLHSGQPQEVYDNAKAKLDEGMAKSRFGKLIEIGDYEGAQQFIDRKGAPVSDLEGAPNGPELFGEQTENLMQAELDSAVRDNARRKEQEATAALNEGNARIALSVAQNGDPYYIPPVSEFADVYSDREVAQFQHDQYVARVEKQKQADATGALTAEANKPEVSQENVGYAIQIAANLQSGASTVREASAALEQLRFDKSESANIARGLLSTGMKNVLSGRSTAADNYTLQAKADAAKMFNKMNDKAVFFGRAVPGKVKVDDKGRVTSADEATRYFNQYLAGWDSAIQLEQSKLGRSLTVPEMETLGDQYFGKIREWKSRDDFTQGAVTTIQSLYADPYSSSPNASQVSELMQSLINDLSARTENAEE